MDGVDEIVAEFLVESYENLERLGQELIQLEHDPTGRELLGSIFRTIHTIKGTSGFLGFAKLERLTHVGETLLSRLRDGVQHMAPEIADALLAMSDTVLTILHAIEQTGEEGEIETAGLIEQLTDLIEHPPTVQARTEDDVAASAVAEVVEVAEVPEVAVESAETAEAAVESAETAEPAATATTAETADTTETADATQAATTTGAGGTEAEAPTGPPRPRVGEILIASGLVSAEEISFAVHEQEMGDPRPLGEILAEHGVATEDEVDAVLQRAMDPASAGPAEPSTATPPAGAAGPAGSSGANAPTEPAAASATVPAVPTAAGPAAVAAGPASAATPAAGAKPAAVAAASGAGLAVATVRVDVRLLDELMNLVGELVLARNQIIEYNSGQRTPMAAAAQRLDLITTELQSRVMTTRMQPIGSAWNRFPRLVRDVAGACGKNVRLELEGAETELDRSLIESITDPLTHIVRNSVDHGIETPAERVAKGKPPEGRLLLRAFHEDGQVHIEIRDDGAGIDPQKVKAKAVEKGLISHDQALKMSDRDALDLIFLAGFSTAAAVTNISGRGVGMDVVKTNVEKINGLLDIDSKVGVGTTLKIKIPLTLAIIPALVINCHEDRYAIPQNSVIELVRLHADQARTGIERLHSVPVYRLRGNLLPLVYLREQLGLPPQDPDASVAIVVLAARDRVFGLVVDGVHNTEEIVVKPLARQLKSLPVYAGATIMGDGKVALILDVVGIALRSRVIVDMRGNEAVEHAAAQSRATGVETVPVVLVEGFCGERQAIPLRSVSRLETLSADSLERAFGRTVVQYDGGILPIVHLGDLTGGGYSSTELDLLPTVVCQEGTQQFGVIVSRIVDIVELPQSVLDDAGSATTGFGAAQPAPLVADGRVTELLEVSRAIRTARPDLFVNDAISAAQHAHQAMADGEALAFGGLGS